MKVSKNSVIVALTFAVVGFFIGFSYTNARNRDYLKQKTEESRQEAFAAAKNAGADSDAQVGGESAATGKNPHTDEQQIPIEDVLKMARETRDNPQQQLVAGRYLASKNRLAEAQECFETALKKDPKNFEANALMGNFNFDQEKYEEAAKWYEKALEINDKEVSIITDLGLTFYYRKPQQLSKAIEYYRKSLTIDPKHAPTLVNLTVAYADAKNPSQARETLAAFEKAYPGNPQAAQLRKKLDGTDATENIPTH